MNNNLTIPEDFCGSNPSSNFTWEFFWTLEHSEYGVLTAFVLLLYLVVGLPWNCLVAGVILKQRLYQQPTIILLFSLTLCDGLMLVTIFPLNILTGFAGEFIFGNSDYFRCRICKIGLIITWFSYMSLAIVTLLSVDRFLFIYKAMHYQNVVTPLKITVIVFSVCFLCFLLSILPLFGFGSIGFFRLLVTCLVDFTISSNYYLGLLVLAALLPLLVLTVCNVWVALIVYKNIKVIYKERKTLYGEHQKQAHSSNIRKMMRRKRHRKQLHLMRVFGGLLCANVFSWIPIVAVAIASLFVSLDSMPQGLLVVVNLMFMAQVLIHPALESVIISDVKKPIIKFFTSLFFLRMLRAVFRIKSDPKCFSNSRQDKSKDSDSLCCGHGFMDILQAALLPHELKSSTDEATTENE